MYRLSRRVDTWIPHVKVENTFHTHIFLTSCYSIIMPCIFFATLPFTALFRGGIQHPPSDLSCVVRRMSREQNHNSLLGRNFRQDSRVHAAMRNSIYRQTRLSKNWSRQLERRCADRHAANSHERHKNICTHQPMLTIEAKRNGNYND